MQSLWEIAYYAWLLLTYIVINTLLCRATRHPAGMHCPAGDDAFVSSYYSNLTVVIFSVRLLFKPTAVTKFQGNPSAGALNVQEWGNVANIA